MELKDFLNLAQILISSILIVLVLLQVRGTGFGAALGGLLLVLRPLIKGRALNMSVSRAGVR